METREELTCRSFLKLGFSGISAIALLLIIGCGGDDDDDDDDDDD